ncbi:hypothetical protein BDQ17DRAFT_1327546 [Cyathus striatus]|nr:hypothetical protein BDQ17DRAFT_1327546 [Cyathus striatus]
MSSDKKKKCQELPKKEKPGLGVFRAQSRELWSYLRCASAPQHRAVPQLTDRSSVPHFSKFLLFQKSPTPLISLAIEVSDRSLTASSKLAPTRFLPQVVLSRGVIYRELKSVQSAFADRS